VLVFCFMLDLVHCSLDSDPLLFMLAFRDVRADLSPSLVVGQLHGMADIDEH
jgi:hypothetical protein